MLEASTALGLARGGSLLCVASFLTPCYVLKAHGGDALTTELTNAFAQAVTKAAGLQYRDVPARVFVGSQARPGKTSELIRGGCKMLVKAAR